MNNAGLFTQQSIIIISSSKLCVYGGKVQVYLTLMPARYTIQKKENYARYAIPGTYHVNNRHN